jgi:hypothetical protein
MAMPERIEHLIIICLTMTFAVQLVVDIIVTLSITGRRQNIYGIAMCVW